MLGAWDSAPVFSLEVPPTPPGVVFAMLFIYRYLRGLYHSQIFDSRWVAGKNLITKELEVDLGADVIYTPCKYMIAGDLQVNI
jgi:hypothetical protein